MSAWSGDNVTNYVEQQTLKPDDDYVPPYQRLWTFDVLVCPLSATERFLLQPLVYGTVFHHTSLLPPLCPFSAVVLNHISSHFLKFLSLFLTLLPFVHLFSATIVASVDRLLQFYVSRSLIKQGKGRYSSSWEPHLRATGRHLPYGITQCYLPPDRSERAPPNPSHAGWYSTYLPQRDGRLS